MVGWGTTCQADAAGGARCFRVKQRVWEVVSCTLRNEREAGLVPDVRVLGVKHVTRCMRGVMANGVARSPAALEELLLQAECSVNCQNDCCCLLVVADQLRNAVGLRQKPVCFQGKSRT